jgi:sulfatase modifying factor 1
MFRRHHLFRNFVVASIAGCVAVSNCSTCRATVNIDFVTVGNPGNAPDMRYNNISVGSVDHVYKIGKYEITAGQYAEFLNAVAKADPNGLYNSGMGTGVFGANTLRSGVSPNFSYSVATDWSNRPVNYLSFWDAARFANWLQNGQPVGAQGPGTTEGGAYHDVGNQSLFGRNVGAKFFVPNEDEWYKAAYYNRSANLGASYFDYPTGSNVAPASELPDPPNAANYYYNARDLIGNPYYRTEVGRFMDSPGPYGTFDQGGNVAEWNETASGSSRILRGGSWASLVTYLSAASRIDYITPTSTYNDVGFRVASLVPEPGTLVLAILACCTIRLRKKLST